MVKDISSIVKPKNINRLCVLLLLLAPLVYMFGSLFTALNGAHGEMLFANETESHVNLSVTLPDFDSDVSSFAGTYSRLFYNPSAYAVSYDRSDFYLGVPSFDSTLLAIDNPIPFVYVYGIASLPTSSYVWFEWNDLVFSTPEISLDDFTCFSAYFIYELSEHVFVVKYFEFYYHNGSFLSIFWDGGGYEGEASISSENFIGLAFSRDSVSVALERYDSHVSSISYPDFSDPQVISDNAPVVYEPTDTPQNAEGYSNYIFGQFFARDNWLENLGLEMLDDELSYGFLPFANLLRNIDSNVLHLGGEQWACMLYGYLYYSLHVVLIDCIACILLAVPKIIFGAMDWFTKGVDL